MNKEETAAAIRLAEIALQDAMAKAESDDERTLARRAYQAAIGRILRGSR